MAISEESRNSQQPTTLVMNGKDNHQSVVKKTTSETEHEEQGFSYAMQLATTTVVSMSLQTAVELGVFDVIDAAGDGAMLSTAEIASRLSCKNPQAPELLDRLLRLLASHSVLTCSVVASDEDQGHRSFRRLYGLAPVARYFVQSASSASLGPFIALIQHKTSLDSWAHLKDAIKEGGVAFDRMCGKPVFEYFRSDPQYSNIFNKAMLNQSTLSMTMILDSYKGFDTNIKSLVDVGGGVGLTLNLITSKYPHIKGINFDLPYVIQQAPPSPRVEHVKGDMFKSVPKGDAIFMKWIIHNWSDEKCVKLLKNCYEAIPEKGKVIVVESVLPTKPETSATVKSISQMDAIMVTYLPDGRERSEQEFWDLATSAGFTNVIFKCFIANLCVMEFFK